jgi:transposase-like protein
MTRFTCEEKEFIARRILNGESTVREEAIRFGVLPKTIMSWVKRMSAILGVSNPTEVTEMTKDELDLPKGITYLKAYKAVVLKEVLSETEFGMYCRKEGITNLMVMQWQDWFKEHKDAVDLKKFKALQSENRRERQAREKAEGLYEIAKKASAIFGAKGG